MAVLTKQLPARALITIKKPGYHADGGNGLYLLVAESGAKSWVFRYQRDGRRSMLGLGSGKGLTLDQARDEASRLQAVIRSGGDPKQDRAERVEARQIAEARSLTDHEPAGLEDAPLFGSYAESLLDDWENRWDSPWTRKLYERIISVHCVTIRDTPVDAITVKDVLGVLRPLWKEHEYTAIRTRGLIESVLNAARVLGHVKGDNPAAWKGHLEHVLKRSGDESHPMRAMDYTEVTHFLAKLDKIDDTKARVIEFQILTASRPSEAREARWDELDLDARVWTVPPDRMKERRVHRVPLTDAMIAVLERMEAVRTGPFVFRSPRRKPAPISKQGVVEFWWDFGLKLDLHGFRASFSTWASEETYHQQATVEAALAHLSGDKVERTYRRRDALTKRRALMNDWCAYLGRPAVPVDVGKEDIGADLSRAA